MIHTLARPRPALGLALLLLAAAIGCTGRSERGNPRRGPLERLGIRDERDAEELKAAVGWLDVEAQEAGKSTLHPGEMLAFAERSRAAVKPAVPFPKKSILVITGGGSYGAYPAGVLVGWTQTGTRPEFDVVTGISTGALIGAFAFLGSGEDAELQKSYTTLRNSDVYRRNRLLPGILSEALADTAPLKRVIADLATDARIRRYAAEQQKGRRFYVGTTDLDARRAIVWDMGAIASRGTPEGNKLFRDVLLASASIPAFFPPVRIEVTVDGKRYVERHIDGGTTSSMFFAPPWVPPEGRAALPPGWLHGSDVYILVAGKLYPDPTPVKPRTYAIASNAISTIVYDQTRSDLHKLFLLSAVTGMNYHMAVTPKDVPLPKSSTEFDPNAMSQLFCAGVEWARSGPQWRDTPPGGEPGEGAKYRAGTALTDTGRRSQIGTSPTLGGFPMTIPIPTVPEK